MRVEFLDRDEVVAAYTVRGDQVVPDGPLYHLWLASPCHWKVLRLPRPLTPSDGMLFLRALLWWPCGDDYIQRFTDDGGNVHDPQSQIVQRMFSRPTDFEMRAWIAQHPRSAEDVRRETGAPAPIED